MHARVFSVPQSLCKPALCDLEKLSVCGLLVRTITTLELDADGPSPGSKQTAGRTKAATFLDCQRRLRRFWTANERIYATFPCQRKPSRVTWAAGREHLTTRGGAPGRCVRAFRCGETLPNIHRWPAGVLVSPVFLRHA
jgi:hypothetical protein